MAKNTFLDWDQTASNNTDIGGIGIQGTNAVSNFDDALRTVMAQLRAGVDGEVVYLSKSANYTALANDNNAFLRFSAAATLSLTAAATLGANWHIKVVADGGDVVIDPNSTELIDGTATITVKNGYTAVIICTGTAFFSDKMQATVTTVLGGLVPYQTLASATTTDLGSIASQNIQVTGTTTITGFGTVAAGTFRRVQFTGALTLTYNATSMILYSAANITTYAGLTMEFISDGSGNWREVSHTPASGAWNNAVLSQSVALTPIATSVNNGRFVKEGKKVTLWVNITPSAVGTSPGSAIRISNLPFTPDTTNVTVNALTIGSGYYFDAGSQFYTISAKFNTGATAIEFYAQSLSVELGGSLTIASGDRISIQVIYEAAS